MDKVVINVCHGGFGLSDMALGMLNEIKKETFEYDWEFLEKYPRHDKDLVRVVELLGKKANGKYASLKVISINSDKYLITSYDGWETLRTPDSDEWIVIDKENNDE